MKLVLTGALVTLALGLAACDEGSSKDPSTTSRDALQPPTGLTTVTWDGKIELRWKGANAESDFKGYHVFAVEKKISALTAPTYPKNLTVDLKTGSIPRCIDNTALFEQFGFDANDKDCEGDAEAPATGTTDAAAEGAGLADEAATDGEGTDEDGPITNIVKCAENTTDTTISIVGTVPTLGDVVCTVSALTGDVALVNGKTYTFFVTAVMGDTKNQISWTSNFVEDTPAASLFQAAGDGFTIKETTDAEDGVYYRIPAASIVAKVPFAATAIVETVGCEEQFCSVNRTNAGTEDGIYIGRLGTGSSYPQRVFVSVPTTSAIKLVPRGMQVIDSLDGSFQNSIPGDMAANTTYGAGKLYPLYGYQVFDMEVTVGSAKHYGKLVFGQPKLATATSASSAITVPMAIILQTDAGNFNYLTSPDTEF